MTQKTFSRTASAVFTLVALGQAHRLAFGASVVIQGVSIPIWVSVIALVIAGYLAYQGFRLSRK